MKRPALIVIDMLNDFLATWAPASKQRRCDNMKDKIAAVMSNAEIRGMLASPG